MLWKDLLNFLNQAPREHLNAIEFVVLLKDLLHRERVGQVILHLGSRAWPSLLSASSRLAKQPL